MKKIPLFALASLCGVIAGALFLSAYQEIGIRAEQAKVLSAIENNQTVWIEEAPYLKEKIIESWAWRKVSCTLSGLDETKYPMHIARWKLINDYFYFTRIVLEKDQGVSSITGLIKFCKSNVCESRVANFGLRFITAIAQSTEPGSALLNVTFDSELGTNLSGSIFSKVPTIDDLGSDYEVVGHCEVIE